MISSIGIKNMVDANVNLIDPKLLIITAVMLVLGLGGAEVSAGNFVISGLGALCYCRYHSQCDFQLEELQKGCKVTSFLLRLKCGMPYDNQEEVARIYCVTLCVCKL